MSIAYRVTLTGCQPGVPLSIAARSLSLELKRSVDEAKALLAGGESILEGGLDADGANELRASLKAAGCSCRVEQEETAAAPVARPHDPGKTVLRGVDALPGGPDGLGTFAVTSVEVRPGQSVRTGQTLFILQSDDALLEICAPASGTVREVLVSPWQPVHEGMVALTMDVPERAAYAVGLIDLDHESAASMQPRATLAREPQATGGQQPEPGLASEAGSDRWPPSDRAVEPALVSVGHFDDLCASPTERAALWARVRGPAAALLQQLNEKVYGGQGRLNDDAYIERFDKLWEPNIVLFLRYADIHITALGVCAGPDSGKIRVFCGDFALDAPTFDSCVDLDFAGDWHASEPAVVSELSAYVRYLRDVRGAGYCLFLP